MEKLYYISYLNEIDLENTDKIVIDNKYVNDNFNYKDKIELTTYLCRQIEKNFRHESFVVEEKDVKKVLTRYLEQSFNIKKTKKLIIFEIVKDENGFPFAKELYTGYIFPILLKTQLDVKYSMDAIIYRRLELMSNEVEAFDYKVTIKPQYTSSNPNLSLFTMGIVEGEYSFALDEDIREYLNEFKTTIFGKEKENSKKVKELKTLSEKNTIKNRVVAKAKEVIEREKNDETSKVVENIDFLLLKLDSINHDLASKKQQEFDRYLNSEQDLLTLSPLTLENLIRFEAELELMIQFPNRNNEDILSFLNNILAEYDENEKTVKNIDDIDKIAKIYFQIKSNLSIPTNRKATEVLALIYIYEIYENKDTIKLEDLVNSYFNDLLKMIVVCIAMMLKNNTIENDIIINYNIEPTPEYVLDLIKQLKFKSKNKDKQKSIYEQK